MYGGIQFRQLNNDTLCVQTTRLSRNANDVSGGKLERESSPARKFWEPKPKLGS